ncbi:uncharacterized protein SPSK_01964 [Sporothrix schenckii 1099-18]|uniref:Uncharacterized protein n=1 Tax=Sporothrix schenckii 1099-18 TaxID=1397361 RepID=A0A0F2MBD4_SPOSC|nr:uncharacterized protein SPSK_01964 [Sporothrix schenckii 1099-18]KJR87003.1 hypothetical protein SPSK_01964 [Sporothrix schenckii 1099-18]
MSQGFKEAAFSESCLYAVFLSPAKDSSWSKSMEQALFDSSESDAFRNCLLPPSFTSPVAQETHTLIHLSAPYSVSIARRTSTRDWHSRTSHIERETEKYIPLLSETKACWGTKVREMVSPRCRKRRTEELEQNHGTTKQKREREGECLGSIVRQTHGHRHSSTQYKRRRQRRTRHNELHMNDAGGRDG